MPAPLFTRLSHISLGLDIPDWLRWGSEHSWKHPEEPDRLNIHPLISSFVASYGEQVFYSEYDEEDPHGYPLDPRRWEMVSDKIYANKGVIRREILAADIGPNLAANLLAYAEYPPLSLERVVEGSYTEDDIPQKPDERLALVLNLRYATEEQVECVRQFIQQHLGSENRAIFESVWVGKSEPQARQVVAMDNLRGGKRKCR